jgi:hypothetical protein
MLFPRASDSVEWHRDYLSSSPRHYTQLALSVSGVPRLTVRSHSSLFYRLHCGGGFRTSYDFMESVFSRVSNLTAPRCRRRGDRIIDPSERGKYRMNWLIPNLVVAVGVGVFALVAIDVAIAVPLAPPPAMPLAPASCTASCPTSCPASYAVNGRFSWAKLLITPNRNRLSDTIEEQELLRNWWRQGIGMARG